MGNPLGIDARNEGPPAAHTLRVQFQAQQPAGVVDLLGEAVEEEIAQAVEDGPAAILLGVLGDVGVAAHDRIGPGVDHQSGQLALTWTGRRLPLPTPVHDRDHQVGLMAAAGVGDVELDLLVLAPGDPRPVGIGLETAGQELVVAEQGDPQAMALDDERPMRLGQVGPAAKPADALAVQQGQHLAEGLRTEVARVIVRQGHGVEVPLERLQDARVGAEGVGLAGFGLAAGGDDTFQVADPEVSGIQEGGEGGKGVATLRDHPSRRLVEHEVTDHGQGHGRLRCCRLGQGGVGESAKTAEGRGQPCKVGCDHGAASMSEQAYWNSRSLPGE